jgi:hypothetical protein
VVCRGGDRRLQRLDGARHHQSARWRKTHAQGTDELHDTEDR